MRHSLKKNRIHLITYPFRPSLFRHLSGSKSRRNAINNYIWGKSDDLVAKKQTRNCLRPANNLALLDKKGEGSGNRMGKGRAFAVLAEDAQPYGWERGYIENIDADLEDNFVDFQFPEFHQRKTTQIEQKIFDKRLSREIRRRYRDIFGASVAE